MWRSLGLKAREPNFKGVDRDHRWEADLNVRMRERKASSVLHVLEIFNSERSASKVNFYL